MVIHNGAKGWEIFFQKLDRFDYLVELLLNDMYLNCTSYGLLYGLKT